MMVSGQSVVEGEANRSSTSENRKMSSTPCPEVPKNLPLQTSAPRIKAIKIYAGEGPHRTPWTSSAYGLVTPRAVEYADVSGKRQRCNGCVW